MSTALFRRVDESGQIAQILDPAGGNIFGGAHFLMLEVLENDVDLFPQILKVIFLHRDSVLEDRYTGSLIHCDCKLHDGGLSMPQLPTTSKTVHRVAAKV